jgi:cysteine desulfurase
VNNPPPTHPGLLDGPVYLDYNATTPVDPRVADAMAPYLAIFFGNPSSDHAFGAQPNRALLRARHQVAELINAFAEEIVFTASGSEANLLALRGTALASAKPRPHIITQASEHPAVLQTCDALVRLHSAAVTILPVDTDGVVAPSTLAAALTDQTVLVSVMAANNETGALQPLANLAALAHQAGALFHCDAAQAAGKIPLYVHDLGIDLMTVAGHKMYAPKGIGALYVRNGVQLEPVIYGGGQEHGLRAGTENVALAVALGEAAELARTALADGEPDRIANLRNQLHDLLTAGLPGRVHVNGPAVDRLPNTLNISIAGVLGQELLDAAPAIAASTGSACHSGTSTPSPVLAAMGINSTQALASIRLSLGRWTTTNDINLAASALISAIRRR